MYYLRKSQERGHAQHGWLDSYHTFSFANYYDPNFMGFSVLRVINEDRIAGGQGFPTHPHRDMEIITYIIEGALQHKDTLGNSTVINPGEIQTMSAGTGIRHSEFNPLPNTETHLLQIWILPNKMGVEPSYGQKKFEFDKNPGLTLVVSPDGRDGSVSIHQEAYIYVAHWNSSREYSYSLSSGRAAWIQMVKGDLKVNDQQLVDGDGLAVAEIDKLNLTSQNGAEFLLFDLPGK